MVSLLTGPYAKPGTNASALRLARSMEAIIHDGRSGDGVSWVSLLSSPQRPPIIDGSRYKIGVRAQANIIIQSGQQVSVNCASRKFQSIGVVVTQSSSPVRSNSHRRASRQRVSIRAVERHATKTMTSCASPFIFAAKMKRTGNF